MNGDRIELTPLSTEDFSPEQPGAWHIRREENYCQVTLMGRLDAFNYQDFVKELHSINISQVEEFAVDLRAVQFLCLPGIKYLSGLSEKVGQAGGLMSIIGASEKLKRQFEIFASLDDIDFFRDQAEMKRRRALPS